MVVYTNTSYTDKKRIRRRKWKVRFLFLLVLLMGGGAAYAVFFTPLLRFKEIRISGNKTLQIEEIFPKKRFPYFWENISIEHAGLQSTEIRKDFFNRILTIDIKERVKYGVWCGEFSGEDASSTPAASPASEGTKCYWFDAEGILFAEAPSVDGMLIPKLKDVSGRKLAGGDPIFEARFIANALNIFEVFKKAEIAISDLVIEDIATQEIKAELIAGPKILFSLRFDPHFSLSALQSLRAKFKELSYIDFRAENKVYYR